MAAPPSVTRAQVLAHRVAAQGLHRDAGSVGALAVLDLGVQEAMGQPAGYAFAARLPDGSSPSEVGPGHRLALAWSYRGAPYVHRRRDLDAVAASAFPLSEADAAGRLNETGPSVARTGISGLDQVSTAVAAVRAVVTGPIDKGSASTAITAALPPAMRRVCRPCGTSHVSDSAMRFAALLAGVELEPGTNPPVLSPRPGAAVAGAPDAAAVGRLARDYLGLLGPAGPKEVAGYLGARRQDVAAAWPDGLVEVTVDGRQAWLPEASLARLRDAPAPELVRLLGPFDPYLQARDRELLVPDKTLHRALWPVLGRPGVLLVDGEVAGVWRAKAGATVTLTVEPFAGLRPATWRQVEAEARRVAEVRGAADVRVLRKD